MMRTVTIEKINKWWYVIVREEGKTENLTMASFVTKKAATQCRDHWVTEWGYKAV